MNPGSRPQDGEDGQERAPGGGALLADACVKSTGLRRCYRADRSRPGPGFDDGLEYVMTLPAALPMAPYRPRLTRSLGVHELAGWSVKLIGMAASGDLPGEPVLQAALDAAGRQLPQPARTPVRSGVAFVIVHLGTEALWANIGWWELDLLYQRLLRADLGSTDLRPVPPDGPLACVWELLAIEHERSAWVEHVLTRPGHPDIDGYLNAAIVIGRAR